MWTGEAPLTPEDLDADDLMYDSLACRTIVESGYGG